MEPNNRDQNRLHLNFPRLPGNTGVGGESDRTYQVNNASVYPTTPSTFPQPVFQSMQQQQQQQQGGNYTGGIGYFSTHQFQQHQYGQQAHYTNTQYQQQAMPSPSFSPRYNSNDPNAGLARQFSNQNLGGNLQRQPSPFGRQPSPINQQNARSPLPQQYGNMLSPSSAGGESSSSIMTDGRPPEQDFDKYSSNVAKRVVGLHMHVEAFFKDSIVRARERNQRSKELEHFTSMPTTTNAEKRDAQQKLYVKEIEHLRSLRTIESPRNFSTVKVIGKGAFGEVKLVQRKADGQIYALKCLVKAEMFSRDQLAHVRAERDILAEVDSPWVVKLHTTFQDKAFLYMLMEFLPGGDLMTMLIKYETFSPDIARFYMAEILLAIEAVHKLGFIHRDIKPDNILLDREGHLKLTDFGLSTGFHKQHETSYYKQILRGTPNHRRDNRNSVNLDQINLTVSNRGQINNWRKSRRAMAYTTVGTPDYIAPENFSGQGYSYSCDWWSLGAIMYESVIGWPPFCADEPTETQQKILDWRHTFYIPDDMPQPLEPRAEDLIRRLLCDAPNRLGHAGGSHGATEIKAHPYFAGVQWDSIRSMHAPFKPSLRSNVDTEYFPIEDIDQTDRTAAWMAKADQLSEEHEAEMTLPFIGYTFKRF